jgi:hypothetical protein
LFTLGTVRVAVLPSSKFQSYWVMVAPAPTVDATALRTAETPAVGLAGVTLKAAVGGAGAATISDLDTALDAPPGPVTVRVTTWTPVVA